MTIVRVQDKRYFHGYRIIFFEEEYLSERMIEFLKKTPKAYWIDSKNLFCTNREEIEKVLKEKGIKI